MAAPAPAAPVVVMSVKIAAWMRDILNQFYQQAADGAFEYHDLARDLAHITDMFAFGRDGPNPDGRLPMRVRAHRVAGDDDDDGKGEADAAAILSFGGDSVGEFIGNFGPRGGPHRVCLDGFLEQYPIDNTLPLGGEELVEVSVIVDDVSLPFTEAMRFLEVGMIFGYDLTLDSLYDLVDHLEAHYEYTQVDWAAEILNGGAVCAFLAPDQPPEDDEIQVAPVAAA